VRASSRQAGVDGYLRLLLLVSLVAVVSGAILDWRWLPLLFPASGVLFAIGGALAASASDRAASGRTFLLGGMARVLLPFWLFAVAMVSVMLALGWESDPYQGADPVTWSTAWLWLVPLSEPPASVQGVPWVLATSFVSTCLWLVLLTPAALWLFRRWPLRLLAVPLVTALLLTSGLVTLTGRARDVVVALCVYGSCWLMGFARHDGFLKRLPAPAALVGGVALMGAGLGYALWRHEEYAAQTIYDIPLSGLLYSLGAVVVLLRSSSQGTVLGRGWVGAVLSAVGNRTLTIVLWANAAAAVAIPVLSNSPLGAYFTEDASGLLLRYATTWVLILAVTVLGGWVEDVAAGRWPSLLGARRREQLRPADPARAFVVHGNVVQQPATADPVSVASAPGDPRPTGR
jgi:hypothetical protein